MLLALACLFSSLMLLLFVVDFTVYIMQYFMIPIKIHVVLSDLIELLSDKWQGKRQDNAVVL